MRALIFCILVFFFMFTQSNYKQGFITLHRYLGLTTAIFLVIAGITGSILAYYHELDEWLNPELYFVSQQDENFLSEPELFKAAELYSQKSNASINTMPLEFSPGRSLIFRIKDSEEYNQLFIDPYTANILGQRQWADLSQGWGNLPGFIYRLHYSLWIPDNWGILLFGIIALIWTLDCFISLATTFPVLKTFRFKDFLKRWKQSFKMRWHAKGYSFHFLLHRAAGLWLWFLLFIFAWSSVAFNWPEVYKPVTHVFFEAAPTAPISKHNKPAMPLQQALDAAREHVQLLAKNKNITLGNERSLRYLAESNTFQYRFHSSLDLDPDISRSVIYFDAHNGELLAEYWPTSQYSATTVTQWLYALHMGEVFGWPYQLFVCLLGLLVAFFSYSGVLIWLSKRRKLRARSSSR